MSVAHHPTLPVPGAPPGVAAEPSAKKGRPWLGWALAAAVLAGVFYFVDLGELGRSLAGMSLWGALAALLVFTADRFLMAAKWWWLLRIGGVRLGLWRVTGHFYAGSLAGVFLPSHVGGDLLRAHWVAKDSGQPYPAFASLVMERFLGLVSAANWAVLGGAALAVWVRPELAAWAWAGAGAVLAGNLLFLASLTKGFHRLAAGLLAKGAARFKPLRIPLRFYEAYSRHSDKPGALAGAFALTLLEHGFQMGYFLVLGWALGVANEPFAFVAATAVFTLLLRLPIAPDGLGVAEAAAIAVYGLLGVPAASALALSLTSRAVVVTGLAPGLALLLLGRGRPDEAEASRIEAEARAAAERSETEARRTAGLARAAAPGADLATPNPGAAPR